MTKVTKRGDELQSKKLKLLEDITSTVREIYKIKGPIKDVRTVIDVLGGKVISLSKWGSDCNTWIYSKRTKKYASGKRNRIHLSI